VTSTSNEDIDRIAREIGAVRRADKEKLAAWLQTHWATARMAAKNCPDLTDRKVKNVAALLEELAAEGTIKVTDMERVNRFGQYTLFTGKAGDKGRDWGEVKPKDKK
jgi:hypothetical protein